MSKGKKILVVKEKHVERYIDISTPELENAAYVALFKERKKEGWYNDLIGFESKVLAEAWRGNPVASRKIIRLRSGRGYQYEEVLEVNLEVPA